MRILLLALLFLTLSVDAHCGEKIFLYGDYYYGMNREELEKTGPLQCDSYADGKTICNRKKVSFADLEWTQFFEFKNNGLTCVAFGHRISLKVMDSAMVWLADNGYVPIEATAGKKRLDFLPLYDQKSRSEFEKESEDFNRDLPSDDNMNAYLVKSSILKDCRTMDKLPEDAILITLGGSKRLRAIFVCFDLIKNFVQKRER